MKKLAGLFGAEIGLQQFMATDIHLTLINLHPSEVL